MPDKNLGDFNALIQYREWNAEMQDLYNKYSLIPELNNDLMKELPVLAMYALSEYLKRQRYILEGQINDRRAQIIAGAGKNPEAFGRAVEEADRMTYEALKPIMGEYMTARLYFIEAMHKPKEEFEEFIQTRNELYSNGKTK